MASVVPQMMGHFGRYFEIIRAVFPDLDTPIMATAPRSWAVVQVAWEMAEVTFCLLYTSSKRLSGRSTMKNKIRI